MGTPRRGRVRAASRHPSAGKPHELGARVDGADRKVPLDVNAGHEQSRRVAPDDSRYTEKETAAIVRRALELQRGRTGDAASGALHLEEIQRIGADVGIPPDLIQQAAEELQDSRGDFGSSPLLGARSIQVREDQAPAPADGRALSDLVAVIEEAAGLEGGGRVTGSLLQWRSRMGMVRVSVKPAGGTTVTVRAEMHIYPAAAGLFPGIMGGLGLGAGLGVGLGVGIAVLGSTLFSVLVPVGALALSWLLARAIYRRVARSAAGRARKIVAAVRRSLSHVAGR